MLDYILKCKHNLTLKSNRQWVSIQLRLHNRRRNCQSISQFRMIHWLKVRVISLNPALQIHFMEVFTILKLKLRRVKKQTKIKQELWKPVKNKYTNSLMTKLVRDLIWNSHLLLEIKENGSRFIHILNSVLKTYFMLRSSLSRKVPSSSTSKYFA